MTEKKDQKEILTLGIESSCDETSAAVLKGGREILSNIISTQIPIHQKFGGVVPEIASRKHIVNIMPVIDEAIREAGVDLGDIDQVAVTYGPGLVGALLVGVSAGKSLAYALDVPLIGVNHLEGHIFANFLSDKELQPPFMALVVSGGHTALVDVRGYNEFRMMGQTRDAIADCAKKHGFTNIMYAEDMKEAVQVCASYANAGDYVLLSPACASWGMFKDFEERGRIFKDCVRSL